MTILGRVGLAITSPRWALTGAADRAQAGRSGSDLIAAIAVVLLATQLRGLVGAGWLGAVVSPGLGVRALMHVLSQALVVKLGFLVIGAVIVWAIAGPKRNLGRAFDLACVAAIPLVLVDLGATVVVRAFALDVPHPIGVALTGAGFGWAGAVLALGWRPARIAPASVPRPPVETTARANRAGWVILGVAGIGLVTQAVWIERNLDLLRPVIAGDPAPAFALPTVGPHGELGPRLELASTRGKVTVIDFWATWCGPCLNALPRLDALATKHPELAVLAINLDDPTKARALFSARSYRMTLLAGDELVSERYGVGEIPHTVVIDAAGVVRSVARGGGVNLEAIVDGLLAEQIRK